MKQIFLLLISTLIIALPSTSRSGEINNILRNVIVELKNPPHNINVQFKDHDIPGKSEEWYCKYTVTNTGSKAKSFTAELIIYNEVGLISSIASTLSIPYLEPDETIEQLDIVTFSEGYIANASQIKIIGVGLQDVD
ncbi:MAG: hypothetical protein OEM02_16215 [Desulfobulbaceae bacterium]|nr:hypothetical protein [Desulfobulbaceae bacterium]